MSAARRCAVATDRHPLSGDHFSVDAQPPNPDGLNRWIEPRRARSGAVSSTMSVLVDVATTGPGASTM